MGRIFILKYTGNNAMLLDGGRYLFIDSSNKEDEQLMKKWINSGFCEIYMSGNNKTIMNEVFMDLLSGTGEDYIPDDYSWDLPQSVKTILHNSGYGLIFGE